MTDYDKIKSFPESDREWTEEQWKYMLDYLVDIGMVKYSEIASLVLGHLNPSQVGTSVASNKSFQSHYPPRKCWEAVRPLINDFLRKMAKFRHQENQDVSAGTRIRFFIDKPAAMISFPRAVIKYL